MQYEYDLQRCTRMIVQQQKEETKMKRIIALLLMTIAGATALAGCNTVSGAGQDLSAGGHAITNSAEEHK